MTSQIKPGLQRITRLLSGFRQSWPAIHVAGTNGKGTLCAYISAMLQRAGAKTGRFTSPHLIDRWDGITIDGNIIRQSVFESNESKVKAIDAQNCIDASPFEILTATAFHVFNEAKVDIAVIECGMGGREDATNVLQQPIVSVITNVGLDHQEHLGNTIEEIARNKAGIFKRGIPYATPYENDTSKDVGIFEALRDEADKVGAIETSNGYKYDVAGTTSGPAIYNASLEKLAARAVELASPTLAASGNAYFASQPSAATVTNELRTTMLEVVFPGRMHSLSIESLTKRRDPILIDGAHNADAWINLRRHVDEYWRTEDMWTTRKVTWVLAQSSSKQKSTLEMIKILCQPGDAVFVTGFGPVDGMPWVKPASTEAYDFFSHEEMGLRRVDVCHGMQLLETLKSASAEAQEGPLIISGSLYLVSDVMRLLRDAGHDPRAVED